MSKGTVPPESANSVCFSKTLLSSRTDKLPVETLSVLQLAGFCDIGRFRNGLVLGGSNAWKRSFLRLRVDAGGLPSVASGAG